VFQAHVAPAKNLDDVKAVVAALMENRKVAMATHNIMAYRIDAGNGVWAQVLGSSLNPKP
jgi:putative IMPACT (imprinted ancient) family translation regulator